MLLVCTIHMIMFESKVLLKGVWQIPLPLQLFDPDCSFLTSQSPLQ